MLPQKEGNMMIRLQNHQHQHQHQHQQRCVSEQKNRRNYHQGHCHRHCRGHHHRPTRRTRTSSILLYLKSWRMIGTGFIIIQLLLLVFWNLSYYTNIVQEHIKFTRTKTKTKTSMRSKVVENGNLTFISDNRTGMDPSQFQSHTDISSKSSTIQPSTIDDDDDDDDDKRNETTPNIRIWVQMTVSLDYEMDLIPHAIHHYISNLNVDPQFFLLTMHSHHPYTTNTTTNTTNTTTNTTETKTSDTTTTMSSSVIKLFERVETQFRKDYGIQHFHRWTGPYDSNRLWEQRHYHRTMVGVQPYDWIVRSDADEFPTIPGIYQDDLSSFLHSVNDDGYDAVFGSFIDRVAINGTLSSIEKTIPMSIQFPYSCDITKNITKGNTLKVIAFRGYHRENRGGHHLLNPSSIYNTSRLNDAMNVNAYSSSNAHINTNTTVFIQNNKEVGNEHCGYPIILPINHYKWTSTVATKLVQRSKHYKELNDRYGDMGHYKQSLWLLEHIQQNDGKIGIDNLNCQFNEHLQRRSVTNFENLYNDGITCRKQTQSASPYHDAPSSSSLMLSSFPMTSTLEEKEESYSLVNIQRHLEESWENLTGICKFPRVIRAPKMTLHASSKKMIVTATIHADVNQLNRLRFLIQYWGGRCSVSIYIYQKDDILRFYDFYNQYRQSFVHTDFHILMERKLNRNNTAEVVNLIDFPHNMLRQMALEYVETDYFLILDVDVVPSNAHMSKTLHDLLVQNNSKLVSSLISQNVLLAIPTFQLQLPENRRIDEGNSSLLEMEKELPMTREEAYGRLLNGTLKPYRSAAKLDDSHGTFNSVKWLKGDYEYVNDNDDNMSLPKFFSMMEYQSGLSPYVLGYVKRSDGIAIHQYYHGSIRSRGLTQNLWLLNVIVAQGYQLGFLHHESSFLIHFEQADDDLRGRNRGMTPQARKSIQLFLKRCFLLFNSKR